MPPQAEPKEPIPEQPDRALAGESPAGEKRAGAPLRRMRVAHGVSPEEQALLSASVEAPPPLAERPRVAETLPNEETGLLAERVPTTEAAPAGTHPEPPGGIVPEPFPKAEAAPVAEAAPGVNAAPPEETAPEEIPGEPRDRTLAEPRHETRPTPPSRSRQQRQSFWEFGGKSGGGRRSGSVDGGGFRW